MAGIGLAITQAVGGIAQSVSSVWTSNNELRIKKQELLTLEKEIDLESEKGKSAALVAALEVKKAEVLRLEAKDKANANVKGLVFGGIFLLVGFVSYLFFMSKRQEKTKAVS